MGSFIATGGAVLPITCPTSQQVSHNRPVSFTRTLGGRVKGFQGPASRRVWGVATGVASEQERSTLAALVGGQVGWYSPDAVSGNLLSPQASMFEVTPTNATDAGRVALPDGTVARTVVPTGSSAVYPGTADGDYEIVPVRPDEQVTVGVWALGGVRLLGWWRDANGSSTTSWAGPTEAFTGWEWRQITLTPPAGAAYLNPSFLYGVQYALPSVAWGDTARPVVGAGCPKATVHGMSTDLILATRDKTLSDVDYTVTEIG